MPGQDFNKDRIIENWLKTSEEDFNTMLYLYDVKSFGWSLFIGHICIEKLLKALYVKIHDQHAPFTHNLLYRLAELSGIELTDEYADWLFKITTFNINARYDDDKREFYTQCTPVFTKQWIENIKTLKHG